MPKKLIFFVLSFFALFLIWELISSHFQHLIFVLPAPSEIFCTLWELRARFAFHTLFTLKEMLAGFCLALATAFPLAGIMMRYQASRSFLQPLFIVIQCLPMFTLAPIMVIWFGWSFIAIVIPTALMIFFPLTLNIYQGLRSTPKDLLEFFQINQANSWQTFFKLRLPWAVPHIFAGFRISSAIAGVGAVAGEWAGAQNGLGMLMLESRRNTDLEITFGALFCLTFISTLLYGMIIYCEKIALPPRCWSFPFTLLKKSSPLEFALPYPQSKKKKSKFAFPFFLLVLVLISLFGCQKEEKKQIRLLLDWLPNPNHIPLYVGLENHYFQEEGIEMIIQKMHDNGGGISYLTSKKAELLVYHMPGTLKACAKGAQVKIIGVLIDKPLSGFIYLDDPGIQKPEDLSGLRLGYCLGGPDTSFIDFLLDQGNIIPSEKKNVSVDLISAIGTQRVDFIYGGFWNIESAQLESLGLKTRYFPLEQFGVPRYHEMIVLANEGSKEAKPEFVGAFQRALQKSIDYCLKHPMEAFECYKIHNPDRREKTLAWEKEAWQMTYPLLTTSQKIDFQQLEEFYLWLESQKIISTPFNLKKIISAYD